VAEIVQRDPHSGEKTGRLRMGPTIDTEMFQLLHASDQKKGAIAAVEFEGASYAAGLSFFRGKLAPGKGPGLHTHPYPETCIVLAGQVKLSVDGEAILGNAGDIVVIGPGTIHGFTAAGDQELEMVCLHASDRFVIDWLEHPH